jgi:hypothetical protein
VAYSPHITANVEFLEQRARDEAQKEMDRSRSLDQKAAGLIAAALVLVAAGVAFASHMSELHAGADARRWWGIVFVVSEVLLLASLAVATAAIRPKTYKIVISTQELEKWNTSRRLDRDPTTIRGEMMQGSIAAVRDARPINDQKGRELGVAFGVFAAAIVSIVTLSSAVAIRLTQVSKHNATQGAPCVHPKSPSQMYPMARRPRHHSRPVRLPGETLMPPCSLSPSDSPD